MRDWVDEVLLDDSLLPSVVLGITVFSLAALAYLAFPDLAPRDLVESSASQIEEIAEEFKYMLPLVIFVNNAIVALRDLLLSATIILPYLDIAFNGLVVGYIVGEVVAEAFAEAGVELGPLFVVNSLAPHGALEIGAIAVAASTGLSLLRRPRPPFRRVLRRNLYLALSLLLVAALAEVFVTPIAMLLAMLLGG